MNKKLSITNRSFNKEDNELQFSPTSQECEWIPTSYQVKAEAQMIEWMPGTYVDDAIREMCLQDFSHEVESCSEREGVACRPWSLILTQFSIFV